MRREKGRAGSHQLNLRGYILRIPSEQELPALVVDEDEEGEGKGREPPVELERVHPQSLVHSRGIGKESSQNGLENKTEVHEVILHSLLEYGVLSGLTNDKIGPLDNNNGDEEGSVASVLEDLSVSVGPFLSIRIFEVVDSL